MEIFDRELGGSILLSKKALEHEWQVVLGGKFSIFQNFTKFKNMPGVFFLKSIVPGEVDIQKQILKFGHKIISLDVEGLVPSNGEEGVRLRYGEKAISLTEILFFWGKKHYQSVLNVYPSIKNKAIISGSPIIDDVYLKKAKKNINTKSKILIATSCGYANHIGGKDYSKRMTRNAQGKNLKESEITKIKNEVLLDEKIFDFWNIFIPKLAKNLSNTTIIVRPHPSEDKTFWEKSLAKYKNIEINKSGSINEQLKDASSFIHFNSTASITSRILDVPTFMILPKLEEKLIERITYVKDYSIIIDSVEKFIALNTYNNNKLNQLYNKNDLSDYCYNNSNIDSSALIIDAIENKIELNNKLNDPVNRELKEYLRYRKNRIIYFSRWFKGRFLEFLIKNPFIKKDKLKLVKSIIFELPPKNAYKYSKAKQPKLKFKNLIKLMNSFDDLNFTIKKLSNNLFLINKK